MYSVKETIAKNLAILRKKNKMTQQQVAERLNYSDKAISRWEHAETLPDVDTLCKLCELYGVTFEYLLQTEQPEDSKNPYIIGGDERPRQITIALIAVCVVWLLATVIFVYRQWLFSDNSMWTLFIWAMPASSVVVAVCNKLWGNRIIGAINTSFFFWTAILSIYFQMIEYNLWMLFILGVPIQVIIILSATLKAQKARHK